MEMDNEALSATITSDPELAREFLRYLYPEGVFSGDEWFSIGDFQGTKGTGNDGEGSTFIHIPECTGKDKEKGRGQTCNGPLSLLRLKNKCSINDARDELTSWLKRQGVEIGDDEVVLARDHVGAVALGHAPAPQRVLAVFEPEVDDEAHLLLMHAPRSAHLHLAES